MGTERRVPWRLAGDRRALFVLCVGALLPLPLALIVGDGSVWMLLAFVPAVALVGAHALSFLRARRRRADFFSGQSERVVRAADEEVDLGQVPANYRILALVGVGDFTSARRALLAAGRTKCPECQELDLCARIWIEAFEGEASVALSLCRELLQNPHLFDHRSTARRESALAIARIAAGVGDDEDYEGLCRAPIYEPALLWACRYAVLLPGRLLASAQRRAELLGSAPVWPRESFFFGLELRLLAGREGRRPSAHVA
jgi:hypothetical protein